MFTLKKIALLNFVCISHYSLAFNKLNRKLVDIQDEHFKKANICPSLFRDDFSIYEPKKEVVIALQSLGLKNESDVFKEFDNNPNSDITIHGVDKSWFIERIHLAIKKTSERTAFFLTYPPIRDKISIKIGKENADLMYEKISNILNKEIVCGSFDYSLNELKSYLLTIGEDYPNPPDSYLEMSRELHKD